MNPLSRNQKINVTPICFTVNNFWDDITILGYVWNLNYHSIPCQMRMLCLLNIFIGESIWKTKPPLLMTHSLRHILLCVYVYIRFASVFCQCRHKEVHLCLLGEIHCWKVVRRNYVFTYDYHISYYVMWVLWVA